MHITFQVTPRPLRKFFQQFTVDLAAVLVLPALFLQAAIAATENSSTICDQVAHQAALETDVPVSVLQAITRTETGRRRNGTTQPWPWTVNMEGIGKWFDNPTDALAYAMEHYGRGARSFDVGCFQINYRWHGQHFASVQDMFDPLINARYAARYLSELYSEKGNWTDAAGAYHSRTPQYANRYKQRFQRFRAALASDPPAPPPTSTAPPSPPITSYPIRQNLYPLLQQASGARGHGSLVILGATDSSRSLFKRQN